MPLTIEEGDLLESKEQFIAHQCNCVTKISKGIASTIFQKHPVANTYQFRTKPSKPGTIDVFEDAKVINMYAQYYPGKPRYQNDSAEKRLVWFKQCLETIQEQYPNLESIAFPYKIGCNLGGGDWDKYLHLLETQFSKSKIRAVLYKHQ